MEKIWGEGLRSGDRGELALCVVGKALLLRSNSNSNIHVIRHCYHQLLNKSSTSPSPLSLSLWFYRFHQR